MKYFKVTFLIGIIICFSYAGLQAKSKTREAQIRETMLRATEFMVDSVSYNGGYLWVYSTDFSSQWGEMEAYKTMIWLQHPGTVSMGHLFLDAYHVTGNEYYYKAAEKAADAIIWGQSHEGGWNYMIDFAGDRSLKEWYNTIGKNGWRLEEFQHYYGNSTFDDNTTSDAARFLLSMYLEKLDSKYKPALEKAIHFILESQYPLGGWPQRYPLKHDFNKQGHKDYTAFYTFNDDVIWENIHFLIQCYETLGEERFLDPIRRGMNFYLITQQSRGAWGHQYNMQLEPVGARTYEPDALVTKITYFNAILLLRFYEYTGDTKFLNHVPKAIQFLDQTHLPDSLTEGGKYNFPYYIDAKTMKPMYLHRKGSNVKYGYYYYDESSTKLIRHSYSKRYMPVEKLKALYERLKSLTPEEVVKNSPLKPARFNGEKTPQESYDLNLYDFDRVPDWSEAQEIVGSLDRHNRWLTSHVMVSNPYIGDGQKKEPTDKYAKTYVGDETDTSPYWNDTDQKYISTEKYIENMRLLINYLKSIK